MKRPPKRIRTVLIKYYVLYILLAMALVVWVSGWLFGVILNETIRNQSRQDMDVAKGEILAYISEMETLCATAAQNTQVVDYVQWLNAGGDPEAYAGREKVQQSLEDMVRYESGMYALGIYALNIRQNLFAGTIKVRELYPSMPVDPDYKALSRMKNGLLWGRPFAWQYGSASVFCLHHVIIDARRLTVIGSTAAILESSYLNMLLKKISRLTSSRYYLLSGDRLTAACDGGGADILPDGTLLSRILNKDSDLFTGEIAGKGSIVAHETLRNGWKLVSVYSIDLVEKRVASMQRLAWLAIGLACAAAVGVSLSFSKRLARPIFRLADSASQVALTLTGGDMQVPNDNTFVETAVLSRNINKMLERIRELMISAYEQQIRERDVRIEMLQAQINPHFLYNTLDAINARLILQEDYATSTMVMALADILRYSISDATQKLRLSEELEYVYKYLFIQKERLGDGFSYEIRASREAEDAYVLKLLIQPFVENAIFHGLSARKGAGHVSIRAEREGGRLIVTIADNGVGMDQAVIDRLLVDESALKPESSTHVGIRNVFNRILLTYGREDSAVEIKSHLGAGTTVTLRLPYAADISQDPREGPPC